MKREQATQKLVRMIHAIESGQTPAKVREFYVFGSYARGALEPNDLDVIVIYEHPSKKLLSQIKAEVKKTSRKTYDYELSRIAWNKFLVRLRVAFRTPPERVDIILETDIEHAIGKFCFDKSDLVLLWSTTDRDWQKKIESIADDLNAGTAPRDHFISPKRIGCDLIAVDDITNMINSGGLTLTRMPFQSIKVKLTPQNQHFLEWWIECNFIGQKVSKVLPYALWWMQTQRAGRCCCSRTELYNERFTRFAQMGNLQLYAMLGRFYRSEKVVRQCLIPHMKQKEENELLVFERGPNWKEEIKCCSGYF